MNRLDNTLERLHIKNTESDLVDITEDEIPMTDKMLLDVPCSGTGVMAKRADIRWRRSIDDILEMLVPEEWLKAEFEKYLTDEELEKIKSLGGLEKLLDEF